MSFSKRSSQQRFAYSALHARFLVPWNSRATASKTASGSTLLPGRSSWRSKTGSTPPLMLLSRIITSSAYVLEWALRDRCPGPVASRGRRSGTSRTSASSLRANFQTQPYAVGQADAGFVLGTSRVLAVFVGVHGGNKLQRLKNRHSFSQMFPPLAVCNESSWVLLVQTTRLSR